MKQIIKCFLMTCVIIGCHMEIPETIVVDFSGIPDKGRIAFKNNSEGAQSYEWDFGDGSQSAERDPVHEYTASATYTVRLLAKGNAGNKGVSKPITVNVAVVAPVPIAAFSINIAGGSCAAPCEVTFTNNSQYADTFEWNFDNGQTSVNKDPGKIKYEKADTYRVVLKANGPGRTATTFADVIVNASIPASAFETIWDKTYGGAEYEQVQAMAATNDVGAILVGRAQVESGKSNQFKAVRINSDGAVLWRKFYGGSNNEAPTAVIPLPDGYLIGGFSNSNPDKNKTAPYYQGYDYWVIKTDLNGNKLWDNRLRRR